MSIRSAAVRAVAVLASAALVLPMTGTSASAAESKPLGKRSLAKVLTSDGNRFDKNPYDYDIVTEAVLAVLAAKPDSPVKVLTQGRKPVTAFIPNDYSFRKLTKQLTGERYGKEKKVFNTLAGLAGIDVIEQVLLYHVVPGATITSTQAKRADGAELTTAQGGKITVNVLYKKTPLIRLGDLDTNAADPFLDPKRLDINKGNRQIAHGVIWVLRPIDL